MTDEAFPDALPVGYRLHWYVLEHVLGQGGFGITHLAHDTNLDRRVAIKEYLPTDFARRRSDATVRPSTEGNAERYGWGLARFLEEARTLARFDHPNIVRVVSVFEANNTAYMVMRFEEGESLAALLERQGTLSERQLLDRLLPILDGLELVHAAGFIHRDIKPENLYVRGDGSPVLLDFGSARQSFGRSKTMTILVAPGYAPLEQYYGDPATQGPWTDIYSLGATCYRAIVGRPPLDAIVRAKGVLGSTREILQPAVDLGRGRYSEHLLAAVDHALQLSERDRPQSLAEWRREIVPPRSSPVVGGAAQRLVAVLAADAAGYSRLMAGDERGAVAALAAAHAVFKGQIEANQGRVIDMAGGSVLAVFGTATRAVAAAIDIQQQLKALADGVSQARRMRFRIGVHFGDVIERGDGSIDGDGVNIALRLQTLAEPGGVTVSESICTAVRGRVGADFEDQGEQTVKNSAHPVRALRVLAQGDGLAPTPAKPGGPTIAADSAQPTRPSSAGGTSEVTARGAAPAWRAQRVWRWAGAASVLAVAAAYLLPDRRIVPPSPSALPPSQDAMVKAPPPVASEPTRVQEARSQTSTTPTLTPTPTPPNDPPTPRTTISANAPPVAANPAVREAPAPPRPAPTPLPSTTRAPSPPPPAPAPVAVAPAPPTAQTPLPPAATVEPASAAAPGTARNSVAAARARDEQIDAAEAALRRGDLAGASELLAPWAAAGVPRAQTLLGRAKEANRGRQQSDFEAYVWYGVAARGGEPGAQAMKDKVGSRLQSVEVRQAEHVIETWKPRVDATTAGPP